MSNKTIADAINEALNTGRDATFEYSGTVYTFSAAGLLAFLAANFDITAPASVSTGALTASGAVTFTGLPTADPAVAGQLWLDTGVLTVSAG